MQTIIRGDIFYADLGEGIGCEFMGKRLVVVITNDIANMYASSVMVAPLTQAITEKKLPTHVEAYITNESSKMKYIALLDNIKTIDKRRLIERVDRIDELKLLEIEAAISIATGIRKDITMLKLLEKGIVSSNKPLVITEGKTDATLIKTAWKKLYPSEKMFFECEPCEGGARNLQNTLAKNASFNNRPIIGLFDNDREGNDQFNGLKPPNFHNESKIIKKNKNNNIWAMLLPVPNERELFVTEDDSNQRYLNIEHYFSDDVLIRYNMYGKNILRTNVFYINSSDKKKTNFSEEVNKLEAKEFQNFIILFDKIKKIFD